MKNAFYTLFLISISSVSFSATHVDYSQLLRSNSCAPVKKGSGLQAEVFCSTALDGRVDAGPKSRGFSKKSMVRAALEDEAKSKNSKVE